MASSSLGSLPTESSSILSLPPSSILPPTTTVSTPDPPPPSTTTSSTTSPILLPPTTTTSSTTPAPSPTDTSTSSSTDTSTSFATITTTAPSTSFSTDVPVTTITSPTTTASPPLITGPNTITVTTQVSSNSPVTSTSIVIVNSSTAVPSNSPQSSNSGSGFFNNKGAVAGVFTVVGLIVLAIIIALIANGVRRRRAKKFDDEIAAAAHDAANTQVPNFGYEDDFQPGGGASYGTNNGAKYSDISHGTYTQPPMTIPESYGMRELPPHGPGAAPAPAPGEYLDPGRLGYGVDAAAAGAAGIGVARARSMRDGSYAAGLQEGASPYVAFAYPNARNNLDNGSQYPPGMIRGTGGPEFDLQRRPSQYTQQSGSDFSVFSKSRSLTGTLPASTHSYHSEPSHFVPSNTGVDEHQGYPSSFRIYGDKTAYSGGVMGGDSPLPPIPSEENLNLAYDGYVADELDQRKNFHQANTTHPVPDQLPNPFSANDQYDDETDEDEVEQPKRILKVANE